MVDQAATPVHLPPPGAVATPPSSARVHGTLGRLLYLKDAAMHLTRRDLGTRYRRSLLGWVWAIAPPLAQLAVYHFVFTKVIPTNVPNFVAFLFTGIVAWNWFATGLTLSAQSLEARRDLVVRPGFPSALLPLVAVTVGFVDYLLALPVLLLVVGLSVGFHATLALLPVLLAIQFLLTIGLGWIIAPLNVFFRDVAHLVGVLLLLGFFITPIFYSRSQTPARFAPLYDFNPMGQLIEAQRKILLDGHLPAFMPVALVAAASVGIFALGFAVFAATRHSLPDQL